ncbi:hypothetical protein NQU35_27455, partial [Escherichia coli]|nr:hypothetical protein [Escherichia coli]
MVCAISVFRWAWPLGFTPPPPPPPPPPGAHPPPSDPGRTTRSHLAVIAGYANNHSSPPAVRTGY